MLIKRTTNARSLSYNCREDMLHKLVDLAREGVYSYYIYMPIEIGRHRHRQILAFNNINNLLETAGFSKLEIMVTIVTDYSIAQRAKNYRVPSHRIYISEDVGRILPLVHAMLGYLRGDETSPLFFLALEFFSQKKIQEIIKVNPKYFVSREYDGIATYLAGRIDPRTMQSFYEKYAIDIAKNSASGLVAIAAWSQCNQEKQFPKEFKEKLNKKRYVNSHKFRAMIEILRREASFINPKVLTSYGGYILPAFYIPDRVFAQTKFDF